METNPYTPPAHADRKPGTSTEESALLHRLTGGTKIGLSSVAIGIAFAVWAVTMSSGITPLVLAVAGWVVCPYLIIWLTGNRISSASAIVLLGFALAAMATFGFWAFDAVDEDAQGGILLLVAPAYQMAGAIVASIIILLVNKLAVSR